MIKTLTFLLISAFIVTIITIGGVWWWVNSSVPKSLSPIKTEENALNIPSTTISIATSSIEQLNSVATTTTVDLLATSSSEKVELKIPNKLILISDVPFSSQAPTGEWSDPLQQDGCEEAATLMAIYWAKGLALDKVTAKKEIIAMGNYQINKYGGAVDTDVFDTVERLFIGYWQYDKVQIEVRMSKSKIINALSGGQLVLVPTNGQLLKNPNYKAPGPLTHMLVIKGYDPISDEFITNDSGTRKGEGYRYRAVVLLNAVVAYPTGDHGAQDQGKKSMIIVSREN